MDSLHVILLLFTLIISLNTRPAAAGTHDQLDPRKFIISGPGVTNKFSLPVQYFYIQPVDANGHK